MGIRRGNWVTNPCTLTLDRLSIAGSGSRARDEELPDRPAAAQDRKSTRLNFTAIHVDKKRPVLFGLKDPVLDPLGRGGLRPELTNLEDSLACGELLISE